MKNGKRTLVAAVFLPLVVTLRYVLMTSEILATFTVEPVEWQKLLGVSAEPEKQSYPFEFAACLLVKDDNVLLPEWLAYHYTVLPLRHLIIAVDPYSRTVPTEILDLYRGIGMNITMWEGDWYHGHTVADPHNLTYEVLHGFYLRRQNGFIKACLNELKSRNHTWTALVDSDEYINYNHFTENETKVIRSPCSKRREDDPHCVAWKEIRNGTHVRNRIPGPIGRQNETLAHWIVSGQDPWLPDGNVTCVVFPRVTYGAKNTSNSVVAESVPGGFDPHALHTVQFIQNAPKAAGKIYPGKPLVDASLYDGEESAINPHKPFMRQCRNNAFVLATEPALRVQHYTGGYDAWVSRIGRHEDLFVKRNEYRVEGEDTSMKLWFHEFVELVGGVEKAKELTQIPRERAMSDAMDAVARSRRNETIQPYKAWHEY